MYSINACTGRAFGCVGPNNNGTSYAPKENAKIIINEEKTEGIIRGNWILKKTCLLLAPRLEATSDNLLLTPLRIVYVVKATKGISFHK